MPPEPALPPEIEPVDYAARWADIVERRRAQMDGAYEAAGLKDVDYWGRRAKNYRQATQDGAEKDPFLLAVLEHVDADTTVLDVGAGTGRHTLALAPHVRAVTAVDPSEAMLGFLREDVTSKGLTNVNAVTSGWMEATVAPHDVVICSHVLYPIAEPLPFLRKLEATARRRVMLYLRVDPIQTEMGLWSDFHGIPLQGQPTALDLIGLMAQNGAFPDVRVVEHRFTWTFADIDEAVPQLRNTLCLREDDDASTAKLRALLAERLVPWPDGRVGPAVARARSAIITWPGSAS